MRTLLTLSIALLSTTASFAADITEGMTIKHQGLEYKTVKNPKTGDIWLDRNLGATQVCTSSTDEKCYGDLYQWGRASDGHQKRDSETTETVSPTIQVGHSRFITPKEYPVDWQQDSAGKAVTSRDNVCPTGFRLPIISEYVRNTVVSGDRDAKGVAEGFLKLPMAGHRDHWGGDLLMEGLGGYYWTGSHDRDTSFFFFVNKDNVNPFGGFRGFGFSVRCIKD